MYRRHNYNYLVLVKECENREKRWSILVGGFRVVVALCLSKHI